MKTQKIFRAIPVESQDKPYVDRMIALNENFKLNENGISLYRMPPPETDFEKEIYDQFQSLIKLYDIPRIEYVVPLIKEFVIDNEEGIAIVLLRYQMDFAVGKGFQMKEIIFKARKGDQLQEIYEDHIWFGPTSLDYPLSQMAKISLDPMLYLLKGNVFIAGDVDLYNLVLKDGELSFSREYGNITTIKI